MLLYCLGLAYVATVLGLMMQASTIPEMKNKKGIIWFAPLIYIALIFICVFGQIEDRKGAFKVIFNPDLVLIVIMLYFAVPYQARRSKTSCARPAAFAKTDNKPIKKGNGNGFVGFFESHIDALLQIA